MATQRTVRVEITATDTRFYLKYIGEDPDFHKACTTLHYDAIDMDHSSHCRRESDDTMSFYFSGCRPEVKHSEGSYRFFRPAHTYLHLAASLCSPTHNLIRNPLRFWASALLIASSIKRGAKLSPPLHRPSHHTRTSAIALPSLLSMSIRSDLVSSMMFLEWPPIGLNTSPRFRIKSAFARLTSAIRASATSLSSKMDRLFNRKSKVEPANAHANGESAALGQHND